ncbi:MAG: hypothetical protein P4L50_19850 [Anaerolineaceae bacterium]|nr:hypothetical protein [Anaerolineaceae bacterium]
MVRIHSLLRETSRNGRLCFNSCSNLQKRIIPTFNINKEPTVAALAGSFLTSRKRHGDAGLFGGWIGLREAAADCAAVANGGVGDARDGGVHQQQDLPDNGILLEGTLASLGADPKPTVRFQPVVFQAGQAGCLLPVFCLGSQRRLGESWG